MTYTDIQNALDAHALTIVGLPELVTENNRLKPTPGTAFARSTLLTPPKLTLSLGSIGQDLLSGIYQVDVFTPIDQGVTETNGYIDALVTAFPRGNLTGTSINIVTCSREVAQRDGPYYQVSVAVRFQVVT